MSRIYLDHAATTPMVAEAVAAMTRELTRVGNASALHGSGRAARRVVEDARELIAARVGARPAEVIFTSGGTESDNLAVKGAYWGRRDRGRAGAAGPGRGRPARRRTDRRRLRDGRQQRGRHPAARAGGRPAGRGCRG